MCVRVRVCVGTCVYVRAYVRVCVCVCTRTANLVTKTIIQSRRWSCFTNAGVDRPPEHGVWLCVHAHSMAWSSCCTEIERLLGNKNWPPPDLARESTKPVSINLSTTTLQLLHSLVPRPFPLLAVQLSHITSNEKLGQTASDWKLGEGLGTGLAIACKCSSQWVSGTMCRRIHCMGNSSWKGFP